MADTWTIVESTKKSDVACELCPKRTVSKNSTFCSDHTCPVCFSSKKLEHKCCFNCHRQQLYDSDKTREKPETKSAPCKANTCSVFTFNELCSLHRCECDSRKSRTAHRCVDCQTKYLSGKFVILTSNPSPMSKLFYNYSLLLGMLPHVFGSYWTQTYQDRLSNSFLVRVSMVVSFMESIRPDGMPRATDDQIEDAVTFQIRGLSWSLTQCLMRIQGGLKTCFKEDETSLSLKETHKSIKAAIVELSKYKLRE